MPYQERLAEAIAYTIDGNSLLSKLTLRYDKYDQIVLGELKWSSKDDGPTLEELAKVFDLDDDMSKDNMVIWLHKLIEVEKQLVEHQQQVQGLERRLDEVEGENKTLREALFGKREEEGGPGGVRHIFSKFRQSANG